MLNRLIAPRIQNAVEFSFSLPPCNRLILQNGIPLYWLSAGTQDVVQLEWAFKAGVWEEGQAGIAQATAALLKSGTTQRSAIQINEALEYYGASLSIAVTNDYHIITLHALTKHLPALLPVIQEIFYEADFPEEEVAIYRQNALQRLAVNLQKTEFVANRNIDALLFGEQHPYGRFTNAGDIEALDSGSLKSFFKKYFKAANCRIFMSGNIEQAHVEMVKSYFGNDMWGGKEEITFKKFDVNPTKEKRHRIQIEEQKNVQGSVRLDTIFPARNDPDFAPMIVLNTIFGGYFGSRLMMNIRESKGYTYGIYSHIYSYKEAGALMVATEAGTNVCEHVLAEIYKEMDRLCSTPVAEEELLLVKNYLLGNVLADLDGPFSIMQRWKSIILFDMPQAVFDKNIQIYKNVTAKELQDLAQRYFLKDNYFELVVF